MNKGEPFIQNHLRSMGDALIGNRGTFSEMFGIRRTFLMVVGSESAYDRSNTSGIISGVQWLMTH